MMPLSVLIGNFDKLGWVKAENHQVALLLDLAPVWLVLLLVVIIIPFIEEIIFRLFLRFKRNYLLQMIISAFPQTKTYILNFWNKNFGYIFYLSALGFALIHITNFDSGSTIPYLFPILVLPQFITGLFTGYLRVRYNFMTGYLLHALHNAVFITIALLSVNKEPSKQKLNIITDEYSLKIEEVKRTNTSYINNYNQDSIIFTGTDFKNIISTLTKKDVDLIISNNEDLLSKKITLSFKNKSSESLNKDTIILEHLSNVYSFRTELKRSRQKVYLLYVEDSLKLFKHSSQSNGAMKNVYTSVSSRNIKFENTTLDQVAKALGNAYKKRFESDNGLSKAFNMQVPNGNFSRLEAILKTDYGILLKEVESEVEYLYIRFPEGI